MNEPRKRKFSLGDILRHLNDERAFEEPPPQEGSSAPATPTHATRPPRLPLPSALPAQPVLGAHSTESDTTAQTAVLTDAPSQTVPHAPSYASTDDMAVSTQPPPDFSGGAGQNQFQSQSGENEEGEEQSDFDLFRYINVLIRRRTPIILVTIVAAGYAIFNYLGASKYYTARARLLFRPGQDQLVGAQSGAYQYWIDRQKGMNTHLELLKSRAVLERVAENLGNRAGFLAIKGGLGIIQGESNGQKNDIIELSYNNGDPERAREVLNEICRTYIDYRREVNAQEVTRLIVKLETQIKKLESELNEKEDALRIFKEDHRMVQLSQEASLTMSKLSGMELALQATEMQHLEIKERLAVLRKEIGQQEVDIVQSMSYDNPYQKRVSELELQLSTLAAEYSPEHFKVRIIRQQIDTLRAVMTQELHQRAFQQTTLVKNPVRQSLLEDFVRQSIEIAILETRRAAQVQVIEKLNGELLKLPTMEKDYANLQRETESILQALGMLKTKYEEAKIVRDSQESDLKILELAELPRQAITSAKMSNIYMGILVGLFIGIAIAFALEYLDQTIKEPGDVEKLLEIPLLGFVPLIETEKALIDDPKQLAKSIAEPFRAVRANLKHIISQNKLHTLMICSAVKGEGKTTLAANMAITFSLDSRKIILIDCDLRRPQLHKLFGLAKEMGVADYLEGKATVSDILKPTNYPNLWVATCGTQPQNPAELVGTQRFEMLLEDLKKEADIVFCDSPALLPVSDVITMAPKIDGVLMVIRTLWTPTKGARQARNQLKRIGCTIYGGILNGVSHSRGYYPYYYGYYGYYSYKYTYDYDKDPPKKFTLREFGLEAERKLKSGLISLRLAMPRYLIQLRKYTRIVLRSGLIWTLLLILTGLTVWERVLAARSKGATDGISQTQSATPQMLGAPALPAITILEGDSGASAVSADTAPAASPLETITDSIGAWNSALADVDTARWLEYYDRAGFRYPDGGWEQWARSSLAQTLFESAAGRSLSLDSINVASFRSQEYARSSARQHHVAGRDTISFSHDMIWRAGPAGWRIIGHKFTKVRG